MINLIIIFKIIFIFFQCFLTNIRGLPITASNPPFTIISSNSFSQSNGFIRFISSFVSFKSESSYISGPISEFPHLMFSQVWECSFLEKFLLSFHTSLFSPSRTLSNKLSFVNVYGLAVYIHSIDIV